jgi:hypothetical protein
MDGATTSPEKAEISGKFARGWGRERVNLTENLFGQGTKRAMQLKWDDPNSCECYGGMG